MKAHILFPFRDGPWGGCNQFLTALRGEFQRTGNWADSPELADVILFDSINIPWEVMRWKRRLPEKPFVQRIDGPISVYRGGGQGVDRLVYALGSALADAIVFQSDYSRARNLDLGMPVPSLSAVIANASRRDLFYPRSDKHRANRIRIISTSWSSNARKGFDIYRYLDQHLDFSRYEMTFIGNSPIAFRNILSMKPMRSPELAEQLRIHDIFFTASRDDPCSNAVVEALACGLPVVALNSGGHPELVRTGGAFFDDMEGAVAAIERVASSHESYRQKVEARSIASVAAEYRRLFERTLDTSARPKSLSVGQMILLAMQLASYRIGQAVRSRFSPLFS
jgi:glycosyltransferase involved in cell wall biosynthesis